MFGKGVYFADMSSKSANYCFANPTSNEGVCVCVCMCVCASRMYDYAILRYI
jgi:hypothetical protein